MPINAGYEFFESQKKYDQAQTLEEKIVALEEMIKTAPKHKGSENLLAELKTRLKKFKEKLEKGKSIGKGTRKGIRKEGFQVALVGFTNSGKSSLLSKITNARPFISNTPFTTFQLEVGTMNYYGVKAQIIEVPSVGNKNFDIGLVNNADCLLLVVEKIEDIKEIEKVLTRTTGKRLNVFTKADLLSSEEKRKLEANLKSKRIKYCLISSETEEGIEDLKKVIFESMDSIRVYTKEPGKQASTLPVVLPKGSTVKEVADSIFHGFSSRVKETRVTGPSAKFANQKVGLTHELKDKDVIEFHTR